MTNCYKYRVNLMITLGGHDASGFISKHSVITKWMTRELLRCEPYCLLIILCVLLDRREMSTFIMYI